MGFPPGQTTVGRDAIRAVLEAMLEHVEHFEPEEPLPTLRSGDIALTTTAAKDDAGARAQVVRRQADGTWLRRPGPAGDRWPLTARGGALGDAKGPAPAGPSRWAIQDSNLGPLPYQRSALTD